MELGIRGKNAVVLASTRGIGKACAKALLEEGVNVAICGRNSEVLEYTLHELRNITGAHVLGFRCDVRDKEQLEGFFRKVYDEFGKVDILINNAGGPPSGYFLDFNDQDWVDAFMLNFMSAIRATRLVLPGMMEQKWGRIINLTSISVKEPIKDLILSNTIRLAVIGFAKTLSQQVAEHGVTVNNIATGLTKTERIENLIAAKSEREKKSKEEVYQDMIKNVPMKRMATPDEIAHAVLFLASEKASYITGVTLPVDGGYIKSSLA